jgi:hypothetical protein
MYTLILIAAFILFVAVPIIGAMSYLFGVLDRKTKGEAETSMRGEGGWL